jgi:hypothetical protein
MIREYTIRGRTTRFGLATDIRWYDLGLSSLNTSVTDDQIPVLSASSNCSDMTQEFLCAISVASTANLVFQPCPVSTPTLVIYVSPYRSHLITHSLSHNQSNISVPTWNPVIFKTSSALSAVAAWLMDKCQMLSYPIRIHHDCHGRGFVSQDQTSNVTLSGAFVVTFWNNKLSVNHLSDVREHRRVRFATSLISCLIHPDPGRFDF